MKLVRKEKGRGEATQNQRRRIERIFLGFEGFAWRLKKIEDLGACSSTSFSSFYSFLSL